jgi:arginyl-tRNA synthetase
VFGDALANLLAFTGHAVIREYYVNDAGAQVDVLARSAFLRYRQVLGDNVTIPEGLYPGDYLVPVGKALAQLYGPALMQKPESEWLPLVREVAIAAMLEMIREDLAALAIRHDVFFSERSLTTPDDKVMAAIEELRKAGHVYKGRLPPPKGQVPEEWEDREQMLFRSTAFGDDTDRPLKKSDGSYTYFASDIAYHRDKISRGFKTLIDVWGADHGGYVKRMQAAVAALSGGTVALDVKLCQIVRLLRGGEPVKMSKRAGDFVTLREVVDEVGRDATRFMMLFRKNDAPLDFDLAKVIEQSRENPVFYVQYAHARGRSVFRNAKEALPALDLSPKRLAAAALDRLTDEGELGLVKKIAAWPRLIEQAAATHEPHRVAFYLHELASELHAQWNRGKDLPHLRFIAEHDPAVTLARLALVHGVVLVLASGLAVLGVDAPEEMR